ncbi:hypothetical protein [Janthinobacterium fluminis]|uniref:Uncharacterized protein n=1 Tax=Janthinobacterium fluminis TaxID=2987524 RepID=A0ABT5JZK5_9BURK|nr:hypothetical protein [Janthinobacterium fluminis]MDC8756927.1 hypothetical protein [Janthinobacterium fluminis]
MHTRFHMLGVLSFVFFQTKNNMLPINEKRKAGISIEVALFLIKKTSRINENSNVPNIDIISAKNDRNIFFGNILQPT